MKNFIPAVLVLALTILSQNLFAQDTESYTKVANRLVELINAADYSGVENLFNKNMSKALPLDKATGFFAGMTGRFGKIQKLDESKHSAGWTVFPAHFERGLMDMSVVLDREDKIAGLTFKPRAASPATAPKKQQDMESYTKAANRLVELINAADYSSIENLFNKEMSKALPLKEATEFFKGLSEQVGKIQKLDEPKRNAERSVFPAHCERGMLDMSLVLDDEHKIAGLEFKPRAASSEAAPKKQQDTGSYTKVANRLVELINAGDYAGIQTNFNKVMDAVFPLDKSSEFFKELTQQVGKIKKLGKPQPVGEAMVFPTEFEKDTLDMQIALDGRGLIAGLTFTPHVVR